ncbi:MAG: type II toxin-antitoxin system prevent-host-death family antitoxin [Pseudomonadota bacterium]|nr:type II toxin-antitoxin system prevent-host-death family antitoxin [Pseudomonadota bacterium]
MQIDSYIAATKAKPELLEMIRLIDDSDDTIAITKNGIPKVVVISMDQYEAMRETMTIMADEDIMEQEGETLLDLEKLL